VGDSFGCNKGIRHDATEEITLSCDTKLGCLLELDQRGAWDKIDPAGVLSGAVVFACILKSHQGSESLGDSCPGDPLMGVGEPACLRSVFDHHIVRQTKLPCKGFRDPAEWNDRTVVETKPLSGSEFPFVDSVIPS
jgi:hypothetical protein